MIEALLQAERMLVHGMIDQAERIYSNAVQQDPRNAIAVVGLARIALERGDEHLAYDRACSALEIDSHNAAALRLEARLSEVFAARGDDVSRPTFLAATGEPARESPGTTPVADRLADTEPPPAGPDARPSEQAVFTRNPTMAEHQRMEEQRARLRAEQMRPQEPPPGEREGAKAEPRPGFFRRLWTDER